MPVTEEIKQAATGKAKWWLIGGAAGLGYLWWTRARASAPDSAASAQITPGGAAVSDPVTPAGGDYSPPAATPSRATSNGEWLQESVAALLLPPNNVGPAAAFNSLTKALAGDPLTTAEAAIVEIAIRLSGTPPEGMPRLNLASPAPATSTSSAPTPAPTAITRKVITGDTLTRIAASWGVSEPALYARNAGVIEAAARAHGLSSSRGGPNNTLGWWIYPGTILTKP